MLRRLTCSACKQVSRSALIDCRGDSTYLCGDCIWYAYRYLIDNDLASGNPFACMLAAVTDMNHIQDDEEGLYYRAWKDGGRAMVEIKLRLPSVSSRLFLTDDVISCYAQGQALANEMD